MRRWLVIAVVVMVVLGFVGPVAWTLIGWPPPGLVLKYGPTPGCEPMGRVKNIEGIEFVEIGPGCFRMGSEHLAEGGDFLGRWCARLGLPWGDQPKASNEMPVHWVEFRRGFLIAKYEVTNWTQTVFTGHPLLGRFSVRWPAVRVGAVRRLVEGDF